jgi:hypothetical protein
MYDDNDWLDWYEDVDEGDREPGYAIREYWHEERVNAEDIAFREWYAGHVQACDEARKAKGE